MKSLFKIIIFFLFLTSLSADADKNEKVVLQLKWLHQFQFAGYYAALEKGFYKEAGLDVEIRERDPDKNNVVQVLNNEAQYGVSDSVLLLYIIKNEPIYIIAPIFQVSPNVILSLKNSDIRSAYDLNNKKILFYPEDTDGFSILAMTESLNLNPILTRYKRGDNYNELIDGKVDAYSAYITNEPYYFYKNGIDINIINPANYGVNLYGDILFTNQHEVKNHPNRVQKFKEASIKGWYYALEHKDETIDLILKKYSNLKSRDHLKYEAEAIEQIIAHKTTPIGTLDPGRVRYNLNMYEKLGIIKNKNILENYIFDLNKTQNNRDKNNLFNYKEDSYLREKKKINLCIDPDWMPFEKLENSKHVGMSADYIDIFEKIIKIPIELVPTKSWDETLTYLKERKCDISSFMVSTPNRMEFLTFTDPYLTLPLVIVTNIEELFISKIDEVKNRKVGIVKGAAYYEILKKRYPQLNLVEVPSIKDGLEMVKNSELYGFIDTLATTGYYIQKEYIGQLKIAGKLNENWRYGIGVRDDEPILKDIFNKAISTISQTKHQEIFNKWISVIYENKKDYRLMFAWIAIITSFFGVILMIISISNRRLSKEIAKGKIAEQKLQELSIKDELTSLYNRRYFNQIITKILNSAKREKRNVGFAVLDIDYFKQYNDNYGHLAGDEVLKKVAKVLISSLQRGNDYSFRLGGEEFGILFKGLNSDEAYKFIDNIRKNIEELKIEHAYSKAGNFLTASFGVVVKNAAYIKDENQLYKEADELLYKAKDNGRNRVERN